MTGGNLGAPASTDFQGTYLFVESNGYDGQFYRVIEQSQTSARVLPGYAPGKVQENLLPAMARVLALGISNGSTRPTSWPSSDSCSVLWIAQWAVLHRQSGGWGSGFLAIRAPMVSVVRMTPDVTLATLCCLWALAAEEARTWKACGLLVIVPFVQGDRAVAERCCRYRLSPRAGVPSSQSGSGTLIPYGV